MSETEESPATWWYFLPFAGAGFAAAALLFVYFDRKERSGEHFVVPRLFRLVYTLTGKWGVAGIFAAVGLFFLGASIVTVLNGRRAETAAPRS